MREQWMNLALVASLGMGGAYTAMNGVRAEGNFLQEKKFVPEVPAHEKTREAIETAGAKLLQVVDFTAYIEENQTAVVVFGGDTCLPCKELEYYATWRRAQGDTELRWFFWDFPWGKGAEDTQEQEKKEVELESFREASIRSYNIVNSQEPLSGPKIPLCVVVKRKANASPYIAAAFKGVDECGKILEMKW